MIEDPFKTFILIELERMGVAPAKLTEIYDKLLKRNANGRILRGGRPNAIRSTGEKIMVRTSRGFERWPLSDVRAAIAYQLKFNYDKDGIFDRRPSTPRIARSFGYSTHSTIVEAQKRWGEYVSVHGSDPVVPNKRLTQLRALEGIVESSPSAAPDEPEQTIPAENKELITIQEEKGRKGQAKRISYKIHKKEISREEIEYIGRAVSALRELGLDPQEAKDTYLFMTRPGKNNGIYEKRVSWRDLTVSLGGMRAALAYKLSQNGDAEPLSEQAIAKTLNYNSVQEVEADIQRVKRFLAVPPRS